MKQYKGYYIDGVIFNTEEDIDKFVKQQAILKRYYRKMRGIVNR